MIQQRLSSPAPTPKNTSTPSSAISPSLPLFFHSRAGHVTLQAVTTGLTERHSTAAVRASTPKLSFKTAPMVPRVDPNQPSQSLSLRVLPDDSSDCPNTPSPTVEMATTAPKLRPDHLRSTTEPEPSALLQSHFANALNTRPLPSHRNRSPYSRSHLRSRSSGSTLLSAPPMTRAYSLPSVPTSSRAFELSPMPGQHSPARVRSPFKSQLEEGYTPPPRSPSWYESANTTGGAIQSIQEDSELNIPPRSQMPTAIANPPFSRSGSLRRRPVSPLHTVAHAPAQQPAPTSFPASVTDQNTPMPALPTLPPPSSSPSPSLGATKYNEAFPSPSNLSLHHYASTSSMSSMSSTPSSARSRSPSISSLDTIEDEPDLESKAVEADRERLKMVEEETDEEDSEGPRRRSLDAPRGFGFGRNGGSAKAGLKRWSICGGERRGDLDLETIWED